MFFKSIGTVNLPTSESSAFIFRLYKLVETSVSLLMPSFSTSIFKTIKFFSPSKSDTSMPVSCLNSF